MALFLDLDGTLIEIAPTPDAVHVPPELLQVLSALSARLGGALACVSGRAFGELERLVGSSGIALAGSHGAELLAPALPDPRIARMVRECKDALQAWPGALVEQKPCGLALHWRLAPAAEGAVRALGAQLAQQLATHHLKEGKMVLELVPQGANKGSALRALMQQPPWRGRQPVFVGDDYTDISAMQAARALGGRAIAVGPRVAEHADAVFDSPAQVLAWLQQQ
ncbi:trehalose-phosphatase [Comamonas endophytica]|uniref:Trehalose 6-phosphate phosphatase n=1 Tax=Comamonas endophytica TaxID=2949090 RepID=A0ABY6GFD6_9BURK|nr:MULTISPECIES: trehalose-phosphatase [unclassified Acidovorax]MCD2513432.1 trehalose-phosphatase [Acidovorax sp. D4N7]UYG53786.1 trehalose-phosphatase [Acidovorax sp. 5MLIR]